MLEITNLTVNWPDFSCHYNLTVPQGALCAVIGRSGGGKTTLFNAIAGFGRPPTGILRFNGQDLLPMKAADRPLSILFQEHNLFPHLTAAQNIGLGLNPGLRLDSRQQDIVKRTLAQVGLGDMGKRYPDELSGGQRQRVALARALARNRPLILLDEPFAALDPALRKEMIALVNGLRLSENLTILMSIHTPDDVEGIADMAATITNGEISDIRATCK